VQIFHWQIKARIAFCAKSFGINFVRKGLIAPTLIHADRKNFAPGERFSHELDLTTRAGELRFTAQTEANEQSKRFRRVT
jgi:hypothetical protein